MITIKKSHLVCLAFIATCIVLASSFERQSIAKQSCTAAFDNCPADMVCFEKNPIALGVCVPVTLVHNI
jgi:hypothetical protein